MTPTGMSLINDVFPAQDKGRGLGYFSMGVIVAPAIGPTLGGYLTQVFGWRSIFFVNLPFGIAAIVLSLVFLKSDVPHKDTHRPFDFWGFFFLSLFMVAFLLGVSNGQHEGWSSHYVFTCWILSIVGFACFLLVEKQMKDRVVELDLFKNSVFTICFLVSAVRSVALFGSIFLLPLFLQNLMGFDEITTGLILLPGSVLMAALMVPSGKLGDRIGPRLLAIFGVLILAYFMWMYRTLDVDTSTWNVILPMLVRGFGIALLMNPIMAAALNAVPRRLAGQASSLLSLSQQVAGSIGIAILSTVMTNRTLYHLNVLGSGMDASSSVMGHSIALLRQYALDMGYSHQAAVQVANALALRNASRAAQVRGFDDAFLCGMIIIATALIPAFFLPGKPVHQVPMDPAEIVAAE
jgi:EmrB/QacA subfamily drug resistance transporter